MAFQPSETELEAFTGTVLDAYKEGRAGRSTAVQLLARAIAAAARDSEPEFTAYIQLSRDELEKPV
jgi:hypothetical protein